jgi:hypothetical protein
VSIVLDATGDYLSKTTGLLDYNANYTVCLWTYVTDLVTDYWPCMMTDAGVTNYDLLGWSQSVDKFQVSAAIGGSGGAGVLSGACLANTWYHIAMVRESISIQRLVVNGSDIGTSSKDVTGRTAHTKMIFGRDSGTANNARIAHIKIWTAALSAAELANEMRTIRPLHQLNNLWAWYPMIGSV